MNYEGSWDAAAAYFKNQFDTSFERKKDGVETVTAVQETDGIWRIVGYFIR